VGTLNGYRTAMALLADIHARQDSESGVVPFGGIHLQNSSPATSGGIA
jgi:hypothetical protein